MDAASAHHVGAGVQQLGDAVVEGDQLDQAEMRIVEIEEQIDIAVRPRLVLGDRPEQVKTRDAKALQVGRMAPQCGKDLVAFHGGSLTRLAGGVQTEGDGQLPTCRSPLDTAHFAHGVSSHPDS